LPVIRTGIIFHLIAALLNPARVRRANRETIDRILFGHEATGSDSSKAILDRVEELLWSGARALPVAALFEPVAGAIAQGLAEFFLGRRAGADELQVAMQGLPGSTTVAMTIDLWSLAVSIRGDGEIVELMLKSSPDALCSAYREKRLPAPLQAGLSCYLERYGRRTVAEVDLGLARWSEDPEFLFDALASYLRFPMGRFTPDEARRRAVDDGEAMAAKLAKRGGILRRAAVGWFFRRARILMGLREQWKDDLTKIWARARILLLLVGKDLVHADRLEAAEDIFFVSLPEARAALVGTDLNLRKLVRDRRAIYSAELKRCRVPSILLSDGTEPLVDVETSVAGDSDLVLNGAAASPGKATGRARVLHEPSGARLEPGEVLVAPSTDPGWTPLFITAAGLVMEKGGAMSHGAVIAREYGIPAVVGVAGALARIRTGDLIEVDGVSGRVTHIKSVR
jgi:rifampicin phosphotransferase